MKSVGSRHHLKVRVERNDNSQYVLLPQHMPAFNIITFGRQLLVHIYIWKSHLSKVQSTKIAVFKTVCAHWKLFQSQGGGSVASNLVCVTSCLPYPWFLGELLASLTKYFLCFLNTKTAVTISYSYLMAKWFSSLMKVMCCDTTLIQAWFVLFCNGTEWGLWVYGGTTLWCLN